MKASVLKVLFLLVLVVLVLSACGPRAEFAQLPDTLKADITALVLVVVSWLVAKLITLIPPLRFLAEFQVPLAMAIAAQVIGYIETATPDAYAAVVILALQLVLAVLALIFTAAQLKAKGYRLL